MTDSYPEITEITDYLFGHGRKKIDLFTASRLLWERGNDPIAHFFINWINANYPALGYPPATPGWFDRLFAIDTPVSRACIGYAYYFGEDGKVPNYELSVQYSRIAAEEGNSLAQIILGLCYQCGRHVERNGRIAVYWYTQAANQQNASAQVNLGFCYEHSIGTDVDLARAFQLYLAAANQGLSIGIFNVANFYEQGLGTSQDITKAIEFYSITAINGDQDSQYRLGRLYHGLGERGFAMYWYNAAAEKNHSCAKYALQLLKATFDIKNISLLPDEKSPETKIPDMTCCICATNVRNVVCLPCKHMLMCINCSKIHFLQNTQCPLCREPVREIMKIYM